MECYSAIKIDNSTTWMNPENMKEANYKRLGYIEFHLYEMSRTDKSIEIGYSGFQKPVGREMSDC